jgi:hypothetical protein
MEKRECVSDVVLFANGCAVLKMLVGVPEYGFALRENPRFAECEFSVYYTADAQFNRLSSLIMPDLLDLRR